MQIRIIMIALFVLNVFQISAQNNDEVTLVVSADGATKEEATKVALRSAIEQAYGSFVSANTTILNDEMVKDEIVTISNGNIKKYDEIASLTLPNGNQSVTLQATVCISKLVSYAQSKGASTEFAGAAFAMNIKMMELNKKNEMKALENLYCQIKELVPIMFDRVYEVGSPSVKDENYYVIPGRLTYRGNKNREIFDNILFSTLKSLSLSTNERKIYGTMKLNVTDLRFCSLSSRTDFEYSRQQDIYLRNSNVDVLRWLCEVFQLFLTEFGDYQIVDNLGNLHAYGYDLTINPTTLNFGDVKQINEIKMWIRSGGYWKGIATLEWLWFDVNPTFATESAVQKDYMMKISNFSVKRKN